MTAGDPGLSALRQRLAAVAPHLQAGADRDLPEPVPQAVGELLLRLVTAVTEDRRQDQRHDRVWMLLTALTAVFPSDEDVLEITRLLAVAPVDRVYEQMLERGFLVAADTESGRHLIQVVHAGVVVDVDFTSQHDLQTGIQRVVRRTVPRWAREHDVVLAAWTRHAGALRRLAPEEQDRVLRWTRPSGSQPTADAQAVVVVPVQSTVVLPEVPGRVQCTRLASLAKHTGNRVVAIGHDAIPVVSADLMPPPEASRFVQYLAMVKHLDAVAGVSASSAAEFEAFTTALPSQGLRGPRVTAVPLANETAPVAATASRGATPEILVVGSHEPRKNHLAVLQAAELLWRQGLHFRLRLVGDGGWRTSAYERRLERLTATGRPVQVDRGVDDDELWAAYRRAWFSVFPSLQEGYGLPAVESLHLGTPVIASAFGSLAELAKDGGMLLVDPHDDAAVTDAMRLLLTDRMTLDRLQTEALARPLRSWDDYAAELWTELVGSE